MGVKTTIWTLIVLLIWLPFLHKTLCQRLTLRQLVAALFTLSLSLANPSAPNPPQPHESISVSLQLSLQEVILYKGTSAICYLGFAVRCAAGG